MVYVPVKDGNVQMIKDQQNRYAKFTGMEDQQACFKVGSGEYVFYGILKEKM
ncbi:hypothetical protein SDC9_169401 [bioreactor metagenome]|uniref:Uncharacterized protein n=1 Tax=bioreactor metagenome TaxID=1076179 RepID=A0A645G579_9ZZZZ